MKSRKINIRHRYLNGDSLQLGEFALIKDNSRHNDRVCQKQKGLGQKGQVLRLLTKGDTSSGDFFGNPSAISVFAISRQNALNRISSIDITQFVDKNID